MGTHPIFESDFDCLTDGNDMNEPQIEDSEASSSTLVIERLHLSRLSNYSTDSAVQIKHEDEQDHSLAAIDEAVDAHGASNLSRIADHVVDGVLAKLTHESVRLISPYPSAMGNVKSSTAVAPIATQFDLAYDQLSSTEEEDDEETDEAKHKQSSSSVEDAHDALQTSVSMDRVARILEESATLSTSSSEEDDGEMKKKKPKSAKSIRSRPRSASVSRMEDRRSSFDELTGLIDLPHGKPLTDRPKTLSTRPSELELASILGPAREMTVFVATWNLNLSTDIDPDMLTRFLVERNKNAKCDVYALGAQEIPVEGIVEWEVMLQRCLGRRYILLHAVRFGTLHLALFVRSQLQTYCSTVDWGVLSVRALSTIKTKGVAACTVQIFGTKFAFLTSHLTAGEGEKNLANRILNYRTIREKLRLRRSKAIEKKLGSDMPKKYNFNIEEFDTVFWFGDLNFRIDPSNGQDQLAECMERGLCFEDFDEQKICFMPTYKFNPNSRIYDTSRTLRQPSFTDRILSRCRGSTCRGVFYDSFNELTHSDHRPVSAIYQVQVKPTKPCNAPMCMNNGEFVVSVYKAAFREHPTPKSTSRVCTLL